MEVKAVEVVQVVMGVVEVVMGLVEVAAIWWLEVVEVVQVVEVTGEGGLSVGTVSRPASAHWNV